MAAGVGKKTALGRSFDDIVGGKGVEALFGEVKTSGSSSINEIELSKIQPNPDQPRSIFDEESLEELAASIRHIGVIQPITIKELEKDKYVIISGERRYRASLKVGLTSIPAYVKTAADENIVEMALVENIQREDLNSIEIALAYQKLMEDYGLTQEKLSERVGKKRTTITNYLRLLKLPAEIQLSLKNKRIDMGHARALISVEDPEVQLALYEQIVNDGLSVRAVEEMVRAAAGGALITNESKQEVSKKDHAPKLPEEYKMLKDHLSRFFSTKVQLTYGDNGKGKISIPFSSEEDLERVISLFDKLMR
ncbi:MAG: ParB/RepB/Spo0J family partition protein [Tannerellaceae bacterium]|jgi:ParB family chromosome partitioning protein|nr:ParB/RepB/Spo0J family partition protein [Tannerellaceae bacterium]